MTKIILSASLLWFSTLCSMLDEDLPEPRYVCARIEETTSLTQYSQPLYDLPNNTKNIKKEDNEERCSWLWKCLTCFFNYQNEPSPYITL